MLKFQKVVNLVRMPVGSLCKAVFIMHLLLSLVHLLTVHAFHNCLQTQAEFSNDRNQIISFFLSFSKLSCTVGLLFSLHK